MCLCCDVYSVAFDRLYEDEDIVFIVIILGKNIITELFLTKEDVQVYKILECFLYFTSKNKNIKICPTNAPITSP